MKLRKSWLLGAAACAWASGAAAQAPSAQQQFEAANKALAESRWADALAGYEKVERVMSRDVQGRAVIRLRKGEALANLRRHPEARAAIAGALAELPANDAGTREDRLIGHFVLGEITERALDYGEAAKQFRAAELLAEGSADKLRALRGLTAATLFFNGAEALGHVDRALALVAQQAPGNKPLTASLKTLRGRVLMNLARHAEARTELEAAVALLGGLTTRVDIADLSARSDLSLTLLLMGQKDAARKYLAYTGAGRLEQELGFGAEMTPPVCGEAGLEPQDVAVVEFAIGSDGAVGHVAPVYSSRQGSTALAFAQAVSRWSWRPDAVAKIPPLLRTLTRVELRCSTVGDRPDPLEILETDLAQWFDAAKLAPVAMAELTEARRVAPLRAELARREGQHGARSAQLVPVLAALGGNKVLPQQERADFYRRALEIAGAAGAPASTLAVLKVQHAMAGEDERRADPRTLSADPAINASPRAAAAVRLLHAAELDGRKRRDEAKAVLEQVKAMPGLTTADPLRVATLLRLASLELATGNLDAARSAYAATGLSSQQCALLDPGPAKARAGVSGLDFPAEAQQWGFEGFAVIEHDVLASGSVANVRATVAYPPFVFSPGSVEGVERFRYDPSYRPDGSISCGGKSTRIAFRLPD